jgi:hypothetical protein
MAEITRRTLDHFSLIVQTGALPLRIADAPGAQS